MRYRRAFVHFLAHLLTWPWCVERVYMNPEAVQWRSVIESPWFGTIAFRRLNGRLSYRW